MRKILQLAACLLFVVQVCSAQDDYRSPKKGSLIGFSFNGTDFPSLGQPKNAAIKNTDYGMSLFFMKGISKRIDFSIRYNGLFSDYSKDPNATSSGYVNELEAALHGRALTDNHFFQPFITAGIGIGNYAGKWAPYAPLGVGLQFNFNSAFYLFAQANYRATLSDKNLDNNLFYSLGFAGNISSPKPPPPPKEVIIPVVEKKDRDNDGIVDSLDACPDVPGLAKFNGCPDTDGDGIPDKDDSCVNVPGLAKYHGCPIPDTDKDGINDEEDKCPTVAGIAKYNGCPIPDTDGDGVNDENDKCPTEPGPADNGGCPRLEQYHFNAKNVQFITGSATLTKAAKKELDNGAQILQEHPSLHVSIIGHTDNVGKPQSNLKLSQKRAEAVKAYMVSKGVSADRLKASGAGQDVPIADNKTAKGRAENRRVEFKVD
ncbi:MAG: OmpA family protein [Bacteroidetes bacterium]|nr:OmpA family protein [Bacteroidota bacterium]